MPILEALSYIVTILGLPLAIGVFIYGERQRRQNEIHELHRNLSAEYDDFLRLALAHSDLQIFGGPATDLTPEQRERRDLLYRMLVGLFEKAYIILYADNLTGDDRRRWLSWEDDMREWCEREDFRDLLPYLLEGEDDAFSEHIRAIARGV